MSKQSRKKKPYIPGEELTLIDFILKQPDCGNGWRKITNEEVCKALGWSYFMVSKYRRIAGEQGMLDWYTSARDGSPCMAYLVKEKRNG